MEKQYVLGINGWFEGSHDASAILVEFDKVNPAHIIAGLEEEKVLGQKGVFDVFPVQAVKQVMNISKLDPSSLSAVAIGWDYPLVYESLGKKFDFSGERILAELFPQQKLKGIPVYFVNHHIAHANSAHYASGFSESLSLVIDGNGEQESTTLFHYSGNKRKKLQSFSPISSLGFLFEATNTMLGFRENESGKTMGLASYGTPKFSGRLIEYFDNNLNPSEQLKKIYRMVGDISKTKLLMPYQELCIKMWRYIFEYDLGIKPISSKIESFYTCPGELRDLAASAQDVLERKVLKYIEKKICETDIHDITISGGVGLNCILNGKILGLEDIRNIFVQPAAGDSGVALGAALEYGFRNDLNCNITNFTPYIGKAYSDDEIEEFLIKNNIQYKKCEDASFQISNYLKNNEVVAVFQGRNEWGPRALGNRSILSLPNSGKLDFINQHVKHRELGRPLAPSMLSEDLELLLESSPKSFGKYMNIAHKSFKSDEQYSSIIHIDGTFRPQCVLKEDNKTFHSELSKIKDQIGSSIIINTSFNADTPIIYSLEAAVKFLETRNIDKLVFNNKFILSGDCNE